MLSPMSRFTKPVATLIVLGVGLVTSPSWADRSIIKMPGNHPKYTFEAEPHLLLGLWGVPGPGNEMGFGAGFRGSVVIVDNGFVKEINNNVAITFGLDWIHYSVDNWCNYYARGTRTFCAWDNDGDILWLPVAMQWNFFLSENWSVFGEPGLALRINDDHYDDDVELEPVFYAGGRLHFSEKMAMTMRLGWPGGFGLGLSFFL